MSNSRVLVFDCETSDLKSDWGVLLCFGYKWVGEDKVYCPSIMDYKDWEKDFLDDSRLVRDVHKILSSADVLVGFFSRGFDLPWLQGKFLEYDLPMLPALPHHDLFYTAKSNLRISRKSLDNLTKYLKLSKKKYQVEPAIWRRAKVGQPDAIAKVVEHCVADIHATEELYLKLRPLIRTHARVNGYWNCRVCGSGNLQRRGYEISTTKGRMVRVKCNDCSSWSRYPEEDAKAFGDGNSD